MIALEFVSSVEDLQLMTFGHPTFSEVVHEAALSVDGRAIHSLDQDKWASVFYTVIIPMLNPLIYSLRNKDVKAALKKIIGKKPQ